MAGEHGVFVALAQLVGFEGGKAFPGGSLVAAPRGEVIAEGPIFEEALVPAQLDFEEITRARTDLPLLADLEMRLPHLLGSLHAARREKGRTDGPADRRTVAAQAAGQGKESKTTEPPPRRSTVRRSVGPSVRRTRSRSTPS